jgi:TetR/AcrR family transcriptional regulator
MVEPFDSITWSTPSPSDAVTSPQPVHEESETRQRILDAAHRVFLHKGTAAARTQEIADEAGVNKALLHYYFGTKATLADAVFVEHTRTFLPRIFGILGDEHRTIAEKVHQVVAAQIDFHSTHPYVAGYLAAEMHAEPGRVQRLIQPHGRPPLHVLARQLEQEASAGTMRPIAVEQFVLTLLGAVMLPFMLRPMLESFMGLEGERMQTFLGERKRVLPEFILAGLRP